MTRFRSRSRRVAVLVFAAAGLLAAAPPTLEGWGQAADPEGDCRFELKGTKLTIRVPGTVHDLVADRGHVNAPAVLSPVRGEFIAMVKASGDVHPGPESSVADGLPYQGTGLLLWADKDNFVRLERAGLIRDGAFITYATFEHFRGGRRAFSRGVRLEDLPTYLRLERRGGTLHAAVSRDGANWSSFPPQEVRLPDELKLGVAAVNTSTKPFKAELEELGVFTRRDAPSR